MMLNDFIIQNDTEGMGNNSLAIIILTIQSTFVIWTIANRNILISAAIKQSCLGDKALASQTLTEQH